MNKSKSLARPVFITAFILALILFLSACQQEGYQSKNSDSDKCYQFGIRHDYSYDYTDSYLVRDGMVSYTDEDKIIKTVPVTRVGYIETNACYKGAY